MIDVLIHFFTWGVALQVICAIHFFRRRPDTFWIFVIFFFGVLGAAVYFVLEIVPDLANLGTTVNGFSRKRRITALEALIALNPAVGNKEELADLLLDEGRYARARDIYNEIITPRSHDIDPIYRRGLCALALGDAAGALPDLEHVVEHDPKYDIHRAMGMLAHAYAGTGNVARADACFAEATALSTLSETMCHYAEFLYASGRPREGREWAQKVLDKKIKLPRYLRQRERPWFRRAEALLQKPPTG
jgi:hypothetical protein